MAYARSVLKTEPRLAPNARTVFLLLADSCNHVTGLAFTGGWLADEAGCDMRHVREHVHALRDRGIIRLEERVGCASIVTFPIAAYLSPAPDASVRGKHTCAPDAGVTGPLTPASSIPSVYTADDLNSRDSLEVVARESLCCDGTGWVYNEATHDVSRCPVHHPRGRVVGS